MRRPKKPEELTAEDARATALRLLARREHSVAQLQRKLAQRGYSNDVASTVLQNLDEVGWQSNLRFAEELARSRLVQGYGPLRIRADLKQARINDEDIHRALESLECDFCERAVQLHARRFGAVPPSRGSEWQKQYRYLATRGFESDHIRAVLKGDPDS